MGVRLEAPGSFSAQPPAGVQDAVGDGLRRMFDDVLAAPMPRSLIDLCDALEDAFSRDNPAASGGSRTR